MSADAIRIRYQSFVHPEEHSAYIERLGGHLSEVGDPGVEYEVVGVDPPMTQLHRLSELRCATAAIRNAVDAQERGFDAFIEGHFYDPALFEMRGTLDIPVVGLGEAGLLVACTLGWRIAVVTIDPYFVPIIEEQIRRYGLADRVAGVRAVETDPAEMNAAFTESEAFESIAAQFRAEAGPLVDAGAEVLLPGGGFPSLLFALSGGLEVAGAPVLDVIAVAAKWAEMAVKLRRFNGTGPSRARAFSKPTAQALEELIAQTPGPRSPG